jgi:hypothetical protein
MTTYSRPVPFDRDTTQPGDRINMANSDRPPYWQTLIRIVDCTDSPEDEGECSGECALVLNLEVGADDENGCDVTWWHVDWDEIPDIWTSLPAVQP